MEQAYWQSSDWYRAIPLTERIASLQQAMTLSKPGIAGDAELAQQRMQRWRSQAPFGAGPYFAQRLARDGITEAQFRYLLGEPVEALKGRFTSPPAWLTALAQAFSRPPSDSSPPLLPPPTVPPFTGGLQGGGVSGLLNIIAPLVRQGQERLHDEVQAIARAHSELPFDHGTIEDILFQDLPGQLLSMLSRTMALELHVARLQGLLTGDTPEERFRSFVERLGQQDTALAILQEYPVLARQLTIAIERWFNFSLEFLRHLCADWNAIRATFSPDNEPGLLVELTARAGDTHRGGRSVVIARFSSGFRVVYKPRSLAVDAHFQELLSWLNSQGNQPPFRTLRVLDCGDHGWVEFVLAQGCSTPEEVYRFYERQGGYLALLYVLAATDFYFENLIAAGEHPVLIDLEALFHPQAHKKDVKHPGQLANSTLEDSVLGAGLLPQRIWSNAESEGIDLSGLAAAAGQLTPFGVPHWEGLGTDEMRLTRQRMELVGGQNQPTLNSAAVNVLDYAEAIAAGFIRVYRLLWQYRDELLAEGGPLAMFAGDEVRVIIRHSRTYGLLLQDSFHPDMLRNALDRDRLFDRLWVPIENRPYLAQVIPGEREDLQNGDIPMFTTCPDSRDLWTSSGKRIIGFFDEPGLGLVRRRLQQLGDADLEKQLWIIRTSLATLSRGVLSRGVNEGKGLKLGGARQANYPLAEPEGIASHERLLAAAQAVGDRLEALALRGDDDAAWIGLTLTAKDCWFLAPLGVDLYDGLSGVALFLAYLGDVTGQARYTSLARSALTAMRREVQRRPTHARTIGAFSGWGGVVYALAHLGQLWDDPALFHEAENLVSFIQPLVEGDEQLDIIGGAAGCIGGLLALYHVAPSDRTLAAAVACGDRLLAAAQQMGQGIGWITVGGTRPLSGFSHGAAGIAWALLELAAVTGAERFRLAALAAVDYERSLFSPEAGNWRDLRGLDGSGANEGDGGFMTAWCHGAPGIGLGRLRTLAHLDSEEARQEIATALRTTIADGFGENHSLCHGDLGNLEFLFQANVALDDPQLKAKVDHLIAAILDSAEAHGWLCGLPLGVESPGLMTGLAGIGYGFLRLAEPARVPAALVLEPPAPGSSLGRKGHSFSVPSSHWS